MYDYHSGRYKSYQHIIAQEGEGPNDHHCHWNVNPIKIIPQGRRALSPLYSQWEDRQSSKWLVNPAKQQQCKLSSPVLILVQIGGQVWRVEWGAARDTVTCQTYFRITYILTIQAQNWRSMYKHRLAQKSSEWFLLILQLDACKLVCFTSVSAFALCFSL